VTHQLAHGEPLEVVHEKDYRFEGPNGEARLLDLFQGGRQLIVYRAFYAPDITTFAEGGSYPTVPALAARSLPTR
jgi:predicted dithiol-disulfide oxidoreductase (DUF899 family)